MHSHGLRTPPLLALESARSVPASHLSICRPWSCHMSTTAHTPAGRAIHLLTPLQRTTGCRRRRSVAPRSLRACASPHPSGRTARRHRRRTRPGDTACRAVRARRCTHPRTRSRHGYRTYPGCGVCRAGRFASARSARARGWRAAAAAAAPASRGPHECSRSSCWRRVRAACTRGRSTRCARGRAYRRPGACRAAWRFRTPSSATRCGWCTRHRRARAVARCTSSYARGTRHARGSRGSSSRPGRPRWNRPHNRAPRPPAGTPPSPWPRRA
mmetsp:Transcript_34169/g.89851  ORF Transcript_34169/g.89851 Transcript_34169/m.89851 type:complete len:271 (+) Transcript_34169:163-975(+)